MVLICKNEDYICLGCYAQYIDVKNPNYLHRFWCWGIGYLWNYVPLNQEGGYSLEETKGAVCFGGLCCCYFGDSSSHFYIHNQSRNICEAVDVYSICGSYKRLEIMNSIETEIKTPCCGFHRESSTHEITGAAKVSPVV